MRGQTCPCRFESAKVPNFYLYPKRCNINIPPSHYRSAAALMRSTLSQAQLVLIQARFNYTLGRKKLEMLLNTWFAGK
jgi:hypothetical protein